MTETRLVYACPLCNSNAERRTLNRCLCHTCGHRFDKSEAVVREALPHRGHRKSPTARYRAAGSGKIAGRITIGRGAKWGAGLV